MGAVRDYCLFIRGLSFGEFSGCAYLRNDGNPLSLFFTSSHQERGLLPRREEKPDKIRSSGGIIYDRAIKAQRGSPLYKEKTKQNKRKQRKKKKKKKEKIKKKI